jgi:hypothetical protein
MQVLHFMRRRRFFTALVVALTLGLVFFVAGALADAPDPVDELGSNDIVATSAAVTPNPQPGFPNAVKVTIKGGWIWNTRTDDCGSTARKVGFAVAWFDGASTNGNLVANFDIGRGSEPIAVGVSTAGASNGLNQVDNVAHPTPTSDTRFGGLAANKEVDIETPAQFSKWKAGCGDPFTTVEGGKTVTHSRGTWGQRAKKFIGTTFGSTTGAETDISAEDGISHTYASRSDLKVVCVVTYDVQGGLKVNDNGGVGTTTTQTGGHSVTAGGANHNDDNDIQKNVGAPFGDACVYFPNIETQVQKGDENRANFATCASPCNLRPGADSFRDTASLSGAKPGVQVTLSFTTYPTIADCQNGTNGTARGSTLVTTNSSGSATATSDALGGAASPAAEGDYFFRVHSTGGTNVSGADSDCNTTNEKVNIAKTTPPTETGTKVAITDFARVTGTGVAPTGTVTFTLYDGPFTDTTACTGPTGNLVTTAFGTPPNTTASTTVNLSTGTGTTARTVNVTTNPLTTTGTNTTRTFFWLVEYSGDGNYNPSKSCTESVNIAGNVPGVDP